MLFVIVWLSAPVQLIAWEDSSPKWPTNIMCRVEVKPYTLSFTILENLGQIQTD